MAEDEPEELSLFDNPKVWEDEWQNMPEYSHVDQTPWKQVIVSFESRKDMLQFAELIGQRITEQTRSLWFPKIEHSSFMNKRYIDES